MHFSNSLKYASGLQERHTEHLNGFAAFIPPHFYNYNTVFWDTNDWMGQNNKKYPAFSHSKTLLFQYDKICSVTRLKFVPSLIHIDWVWRWQSITLCQKGSNTRYLERLRIDEEYMSTVQRPNEDHLSHRLYKISFPPKYVTFDQTRNISTPGFFREILCICKGCVLH